MPACLERLRVGGLAGILGAVIGQGFDSVLAAAQEGSEAAFSRLWRDGNPALLRYLRVMAPEAAEDVAAETWLQVVRGLAGFRGDEQGWHPALSRAPVGWPPLP